MNKPLSNNEDNQRIYISAFELEQREIKSEVRYFANNNERNLFENLISNKDNYNKVVKTPYWLDVDYNLYKMPPNLDQVLNLFKESKRLLKNLVQNRKDIQNEIDDVLDEEIINNVLSEPEIDEEFYYEKCNYILIKLKEFQSANSDKEPKCLRINSVTKYKIKLISKI